MKAEGKNIQSEHTDNEALIHELSERSGSPATVATKMEKMIDPIVADG